MSATKSKPRRRLSATLKPLAFSLILSMSLTGCAHFVTRTEFLTPKFTDSELSCQRAPAGQLPPTATNSQVADRVTGIDEAGEDCRQKLDRAKMKVEVFNEVVDQVNAHKKLKKKD